MDGTRYIYLCDTVTHWSIGFLMEPSQSMGHTETALILFLCLQMIERRQVQVLACLDGFSLVSVGVWSQSLFHSPFVFFSRFTTLLFFIVYNRAPRWSRNMKEQSYFAWEDSCPVEQRVQESSLYCHVLSPMSELT